MDPPRAGLDKATRKTLISMSPKAMIYISCNPSTFSRDLNHFISNDYILKELTLIDMFPYTHHIEIISLIIKN